MIIWLSVALAAPPKTIRVPFPSTRVFDEQTDTVCLQLPIEGGTTSSRFELASFEVDCVVADDWMTVCITLTEPEWPASVPRIVCGRQGDQRVNMLPVRAFDPREDVWDGVGLLHSVHIFEAVYRVDHPDVPGIMNEGRCGIQNGLFWFETTNDVRQQECILVLPDGKERRVPIRLRPRARKVGN